MPAFGYSSDDLRRWDETGVDPHGPFTREAIEGMKAKDRPTVRVKYDCDLINEDGQRASDTRSTTGRIIVDGNNPWLEVWAGGKWIAERFSWGLVLEVLNDRFAAPVYLSTRVEYEV